MTMFPQPDEPTLFFPDSIPEIWRAKALPAWEIIPNYPVPRDTTSLIFPLFFEFEEARQLLEELKSFGTIVVLASASVIVNKDSAGWKWYPTQGELILALDIPDIASSRYSDSEICSLSLAEGVSYLERLRSHFDTHPDRLRVELTFYEPGKYREVLERNKQAT